MLYLIIIFLGALLLFQVQPIIAKSILPYFGGGAAIWTACLLFFQAFLLLGYLYAHCLSKLNSLSNQAVVHTVLLLLSLFFLPMHVTDTNLIQTSDSPMLDILTLLTLTVGLPYFILASTSPLVQRWISYNSANKLPYKLYSLSNLGSLIALLSYPFLIEPMLSSQQQSLFWSIGYFSFVVAFNVLNYVTGKKSKYINPTFLTAPNRSGADKSVQILWLLLSAVGVVLLVSTTNAMSQNVPPVPFLWILPLCIYLITFIISFHSPKYYVRWYWFIVFAIVALVGILLFYIGSQFEIITQILLYSLILLSACMICHGELALLKPDVDKLTLYYLYIAIGGFAGSLFVAFIAQSIFTHFYEYPLAVLSVFVLLAASLIWQKNQLSPQTECTASGNTISLPNIKLFIAFNVASLLVLLSLFFYLEQLFGTSDIVNTRNFYGVLSVKDVVIDGEPERRLIDGTTSHGTQSLEPDKAHIARSYYRKGTGVHMALEYLGKDQQIHAGFVGLGAGTLAAYGREGDHYTFYELNPNVKRLAYSHFSYLSQSPAKIEVLLGDGRMSLYKEMEQSGSNKYNLLVIDAFSGGSIPVHLLTKEAFELYSQHLGEDGIIAVHISNSHLELSPVVRGLADFNDQESFYIKTNAEKKTQHDAEWVLITNKDHAFARRLNFVADDWPESRTILWTDNKSNLLSVLR
jgi:spermidine synthase